MTEQRDQMIESQAGFVVPYTTSSLSLPALIEAAGERASYRIVEFFTAQIRNPNMRRAYVRAVGDFCVWLETQGIISIATVSSLHVATYVEDLGRETIDRDGKVTQFSAPTTKWLANVAWPMFEQRAGDQQGCYGHRWQLLAEGPPIAVSLFGLDAKLESECRSAIATLAPLAPRSRR